MNQYTTDVKDRKKMVEILKKLENNYYETLEYSLLKECESEGVEYAMECIKELIADGTLFRGVSTTIGRIK